MRVMKHVAMGVIFRHTERFVWHDAFFAGTRSRYKVPFERAVEALSSALPTHEYGCLVRSNSQHPVSLFLENAGSRARVRRTLPRCLPVGDRPRPRFNYKMNRPRALVQIDGSGESVSAHARLNNAHHSSTGRVSENVWEHSSVLEQTTMV